MNVLVVDATDPSLALAAAGIGATVVIVGTDGAEVGALARRVDDAGGRALAFVGAPDDALGEMLAELFPPN